MPGETIPIYLKADSAEELEEMLPKELKAMEEKLGVKLENPVDTSYSVQFYTGDNPNKGGIMGVGESYEAAVQNAREQSPVELTDGYNQIVRLEMQYELSEKQAEKMKETSEPPRASYTPGYRTRQIF